MIKDLLVVSDGTIRKGDAAHLVKITTGEAHGHASHESLEVDEVGDVWGCQGRSRDDSSFYRLQSRLALDPTNIAGLTRILVRQRKQKRSTGNVRPCSPR